MKGSKNEKNYQLVSLPFERFCASHRFINSRKPCRAQGIFAFRFDTSEILFVVGGEQTACQNARRTAVRPRVFQQQFARSVQHDCAVRTRYPCRIQGSGKPQFFIFDRRYEQSGKRSARAAVRTAASADTTGREQRSRLQASVYGTRHLLRRLGRNTRRHYVFRGIRIQAYDEDRQNDFGGERAFRSSERRAHQTDALRNRCAQTVRHTGLRRYRKDRARSVRKRQQTKHGQNRL